MTFPSVPIMCKDGATHYSICFFRFLCARTRWTPSSLLVFLHHLTSINLLGSRDRLSSFSKSFQCCCRHRHRGRPRHRTASAQTSLWFCLATRRHKRLHVFQPPPQGSRQVVRSIPAQSHARDAGARIVSLSASSFHSRYT